MPDPAGIISAVYSNCHVRVLENPAALAGAILTALRAEGWVLVQAEGTVTEWAVRSDGAPGALGVYPYPDEAAARYAEHHYNRIGWGGQLMSRQVGPWAEVPAPETVKEDEGDG